MKDHWWDSFNLWDVHPTLRAVCIGLIVGILIVDPWSWKGIVALIGGFFTAVGAVAEIRERKRHREADHHN